MKYRIVPMIIGKSFSILDRMNNCGIYKITNLVNGKIYIGSAVGIKKRWNEHKRLLRKNTHINPHLQSAWNKYGENQFLFEIIELLEDEDIIKIIELQHIKNSKCCDPKIGYNLTDEFGLHPINKAKRKLVQLLNPNDELITHLGLASFGRKYNLPFSKVSDLVNGKLGSFHGWKSLTFKYADMHAIALERGKLQAKVYELIDPSGIRIQVKNLKQFCEQRNIDCSGLSKVAKGLKYSYKNFKSVPEMNITKKIKKGNGRNKLWTFFGPTGVLLEIKELMVFAKQNNLSHNMLRRLSKGEIPYYKGYKTTIYFSDSEIKKYDVRFKGKGRNFEVVSPKGERIIISNLRKFCLEHNLDEGGMSSVINARTGYYKGYQPIPELRKDVYYTKPIPKEHSEVGR